MAKMQMESAVGGVGQKNLCSKQVPVLEQTARGGLSPRPQHLQTDAAGLTLRCLEREKATFQQELPCSVWSKDQCRSAITSAQKWRDGV